MQTNFNHKYQMPLTIKQKILRILNAFNNANNPREGMLLWFLAPNDSASDIILTFLSRYKGSVRLGLHGGSPKSILSPKRY